MKPPLCSGCERPYAGEDGWGAIYVALPGGIDPDYVVWWVCSRACASKAARELVALIAYVLAVSRAPGGTSGGPFDVAAEEES